MSLQQFLPKQFNLLRNIHTLVEGMVPFRLHVVPVQLRQLLVVHLDTKKPQSGFQFCRKDRWIQYVFVANKPQGDVTGVF